MLLINNSNSKEFFYAIYGLIINLKHIPTYEKFVLLTRETLTPFVTAAEQEDDDDYRSVADFPLRGGGALPPSPLAQSTDI